MATPWTRLENGTLWKAAEALYHANRLPYHNMNHVRSLYRHAAKIGLAYDERLDENILGHDVIMNLGPGHNERACAAWLSKVTGRSANWAAPILDTIEHRPSEDRTGLAMLDLMDFTDPTTTRHNTELLRQEAMKKAGANFDQRKWLMGTMAYLDGLFRRIREDLPLVSGHPHAVHWQAIAKGISITMVCAPMRYDPHPALEIRRHTIDQEACLRYIALPPDRTGRTDLQDAIATDHLNIAADDLRVHVAARLGKALAGLLHAGMIEQDRVAGHGYRLTADGSDWMSRMDASHPVYPEPSHEDDLPEIG